MNRRGVALFAVMVALLLAGALASVVLAAARLRWLSGYRQLAGRQAYEAAAGLVAQHVTEWDSLVTSGLLPGTVAPLAGPSVPGSIRTHDSVIRLGVYLFLVRSVGEVTAADGSVLARDGVAQLVELQPSSATESTSSAAGSEAPPVYANCRYAIEIIAPGQSTPNRGACSSGSGNAALALADGETVGAPHIGSSNWPEFRTPPLPVVRGWWRWP
jgi:hypothetical protein